MSAPAARAAAVLAAAYAATAGAPGALAAYTGTTNFQAADPVGGPYVWNNPLNWTAGVPTSSTLAVIPTSQNIQIVTGDVAHGIQFTSTGGDMQIQRVAGTDVLTLTSTDAVTDTNTSRAVALNVAAGTTGELRIIPNIILGNASTAATPNPVASFNNDQADGRLRIDGRVVQTAGQSWGLTITGTRRVEIRSANNAGNYLTNRYDFSGPFTVVAGAHARIYNNVLPYGAGLPNVLVDGQFRHSANGNAIIVNAIDGAATGIIERQAGNELVIGANGGNGTFRGGIVNNATRLVKIGAGTQTLTGEALTTAEPITPTSAFSTITLMEGVVSVPSIANSGTNSALGRGNGGETVNSIAIAGTTFDGGTLRYTGGAAASNRAIDVGFRGGRLESSGTGPLTLSGAVTSTDLARAYGDNVETGTSQIVPNMYGIAGLGAIASQLTIIQAGGGTTNVANTTPVSIDETARTMELAAGATNGVPGNGFGAPRFLFQSKVGLNRTFTLGGTNAGDNTISGVLADSALGGKLNVNKADAGTWKLTGANTYTGATTVSGGTLALGSALTSTSGVTVASGATLRLDAGGSVNTAALSLADGSRLDVTTNTVAFDTTVPGHDAATLLAKLASAYDHGKWDLAGIGSSAASVNAGTTLAAFSSGNTLTIRYTWIGDLNGDGKVDNSDQTLLAGPNVDLNFDGKKSSDDYALFALGAAIAGNQTIASAAVPEPASLAGLAVAVAPLASRRRRSR